MAQKPRLKFIYSSVLSRDLTLVSHLAYEEDRLNEELDFPTLNEVRRSIQDLEQSSLEQKLTFTSPTEIFAVHALVDRGITFLCITQPADTHYLPFAFLQKVKEQFSEQPSLISRSYQAGEDEFDRDFGPVLVKIMDDFNSGRADKMSKVEEQIEDVKRIMLLNVDKIMERGERLNDLITKTEELESQGQEFRRQARTVFVQARCRNLKLWIAIGVMFSIFLTLIILVATGVIKS